MELEISQQEAGLLVSELKVRLKELRMELVKTDDRSYRRDLRASIDQLERILARLNNRPAAKKIA